MQRAEKMESDKVRSISHALDVLNEAAKDSSSELKDMISKDYRRFKDTLTDLSPEIRSAFRDMKNATVESIAQAQEQVLSKTRDVAEKVDKSVHQNPWYFLAGSTAFGALVGFLLARKTR